MGGVIFVLAIVVIVCFIYWKKSQNKRIPEGKKSIEKVNEANNSKRENLHKTSDNSNGLSKNEDLERKNKKEVYDASRKKDRGKKRREKKKSNEIKSEVKAEEVKEEKTKSYESKKETKIKNQDIDVKVSHEADKVKEDAQASKENPEDLGKNLKKENQVKTDKVKEEKIAKSQEVKEEEIKADESKKETKIENQDIDVKVSHEADKVKEDAQASKENSEDLGKNLKKENQVKAKEVKEENQIKPEEVKEEKVKTEEIKKEKISEPEEIKREKENLKITNEKYSDLISSLKNNPWKKEDLNTKVKLENTRTKKTISEEEIDNLPLEKIKSSLSPESVSEFLNAVKTNPTILKRKDDTAYEFTSKDKDEIELIKKRYNLLDRDIDKITSVLIFDKDNFKVKEVKDILAEGKNRIYMETKF